jgi:hypothetical protein
MMASRSGKRVVGALTIAYGAVLGLFWAWVFLAAGAEPLRAGTAGEASTTLLFALVPVLLLVTGAALCSLPADTPRRTRATVAVMAVTVALLAAKALLASHWAADRLHATGFLEVLSHLVGVVLMAVVVVPSAVWALVLAGTAASLSGEGPSGRRRLFTLGGLGLLLVAALVGGWVYLRPAEANMAGLEGTWRDPANPKHSYQFRANGAVDAWYGTLPMGRFMTWQRDGRRITVRTERNWDFVGEVDGDEIRGKVLIRDERGETTNTADAVWRRE